MKIKCNSEQKAIKGLLVKENEYNTLAINSIGDVLVERDDKGEERWYCKEFFYPFDSSKLQYVKARI